MTLDELIDHLRRMRAAYPETAGKPALILEAKYEGGEYSHDAEVPVRDVRAHTDGIVIASISIRRVPVVAACGDEFLANYERRRGLQ